MLEANYDVDVPWMRSEERRHRVGGYISLCISWALMVGIETEDIRNEYLKGDWWNEWWVYTYHFAYSVPDFEHNVFNILRIVGDPSTVWTSVTLMGIAELAFSSQ